jgi:hypothetical protein
MAKPVSKKSSARRALDYGAGLLAALFAGVQLAPEVLAWPHAVTIGDTSIYSERPIEPGINSILAKSDRLLQSSAIYADGYSKRIFLTDGGWRWQLLALEASKTFALTRPVTGTIIVNSSSIADDQVRNGGRVGGVRSLSSVITHERTHGLIRARYGLFASLTAPTWLTEGYCDYVARESSLTSGDVAALKRSGKDHPALVYYEGRQKVAHALETEGRSVGQLFAEN